MVEAIEVYPPEVVLDARGEQQLLVTAHLDNGAREDVTDQVRYLANNTEVAEVGPDGRLRGLRPGETFVTVQAAGHTTTAWIGVVGTPLPEYPQVPTNNFIDRLVFDKLSRFHRIPSEVSSDEEDFYGGFVWI